MSVWYEHGADNMWADILYLVGSCSGQLSANVMVHDEEEGTSVQLAALLPATATAAQPTERDASAHSRAHLSTASISTAQPQSKGASAAAQTSTDMPTSSYQEDAQISQEVDMELDAFDEPVSPALCMEALSDTEEGLKPTAANRSLHSSPPRQEQLERPANQLQGSSLAEGSGHPRRSTSWQEQSAGPASGLQRADLKEARAIGGPWKEDPPPPPPDSPPPPPPPPEELKGNDSAAEVSAGEGDSQHLNKHGKARAVVAAPGRPPPLPRDSSEVGVGSGLLSALLPVEGPAAGCLTAGTKPACIELLEDQSRSMADHTIADTVQLAGQHLLSPAAQQSYGPLWTHAPHSHAQGRRDMQGHRSPPYLHQPQLEYGRQVEQPWHQQQPQSVGIVQEQALQQQHWRQQPPHMQIQQLQQQTLGSGNDLLADTGGLGSMLQSIMENVRSAGAAVRQMGGPVPPAGQLGPPSGQAGATALASHLQHSVAHYIPTYSAQAHVVMHQDPHNDGIGSGQQPPDWRTQPSQIHLAPPYGHNWQLQQSAPGQQVGLALLLCPSLRSREISTRLSADHLEY